MNYKKSIKNKNKPYHEKGTSSVSNLAKKYGVSKHAAIRWHERVFGCEPRHLTDDELDSIAKVLVGSLDFTLTPELSGIFPLLDNYQVVVRKGIIVTVKYKG